MTQGRRSRANPGLEADAPLALSIPARLRLWIHAERNRGSPTWRTIFGEFTHGTGGIVML